MKQVDKNLRILTELDLPATDYYDVRESPFDLYGQCPMEEDGFFRRLPGSVAAACSESVATLAIQTAGIRVRFTTDSDYIVLRTPQVHRNAMPLVSLAGASGFDMYTVEDGKYTCVGTCPPSFEGKDPFEAVVNFDDRRTRDVLVNFPSYDNVTQLFIGLRAGSILGPGGRYGHPLPIVFYGSSITQGACASRPGNTYVNFLSRALDTDYMNLGFAGSCKGEETLCRYMASLPMSLFFMDYDHNAPNPAFLQATHWRVYDTVRQVQPRLPIVITSKTDPERQAHWQKDKLKKLEIIRETYRRAVDSGDRNVYFLDGQSIFPAYGGNDCTVDGCHPNDLGFYVMAQAFEKVIREALSGI